MPRALDISSALARVVADASGQATALFTVTNATATDVSGAPRIACLDGADVVACRVDGAATRVFKPGITTTLATTMRVAPGVAAGDYRVRLDIEVADAAVGVQRGPELVLAVAAAPTAVVAKRGGGTLLLLILGVLALVALVVGAFVLARPSPERQALRFAGAWLAAARRGDAAALAAAADPPHLIENEVVATRGELAPRYATFVATPSAKALATERLDAGAVAPATDGERPPTATQLGLDEHALVVTYRDAQAHPRLRLWFRRGADGVENAGFALAPPAP